MIEIPIHRIIKTRLFEILPAGHLPARKYRSEGLGRDLIIAICLPFGIYYLVLKRY